MMFKCLLLIGSFYFDHQYEWLAAAGYLLINELELQRVALGVHVDGHVPHAPGLVLHQHRAFWKEKHTHDKRDLTRTLNVTAEKLKEQRAHTVAANTRCVRQAIQGGQYLLNLRLYSPGSHCAARELHAAPGPLFCGSLKYFLIFALQRTKYSKNHSQRLRAVHYCNSCTGTTT